MSVSVTQDHHGVRFDGSMSWANSDPISTGKALQVPIAGSERQSRKYAIFIRNTGTVQVNFTFQVGETIDGVTSWANTMATINVPAGARHFGVYDDLFVLGLAQIVAANAAAVPVDGAFTAYIRIRELLD